MMNEVKVTRLRRDGGDVGQKTPILLDPLLFSCRLNLRVAVHLSRLNDQ